MIQFYHNYSRKKQKEILPCNKYDSHSYLRTHAIPDRIAPYVQGEPHNHDAGTHYHIPRSMDEKMCLPESRETLELRSRVGVWIQAV